MTSQRWTNNLWIVRHGQSDGNVARDAADEAALDRIPITGRDVDVPLSELGERQSIALGSWFAGAAAPKPQVLLTSPYKRAIQTGEIIRNVGGADVTTACTDERLREKEFGILDGFTLAGVRNHFPEQADIRKVLGKFYHRPPGGESWCDVILRLRSLLDTVSLHYGGGDVLIVAHQVVVLCMRYILEGMDEQQIMAIDAEGDVANCALTHYKFEGEAATGRLALQRYNYTVPVEQVALEVTRAPDPPVAARG